MFGPLLTNKHSFISKSQETRKLCIYCLSKHLSWLAWNALCKFFIVHITIQVCKNMLNCNFKNPRIEQLQNHWFELWDIYYQRLLLYVLYKLYIELITLKYLFIINLVTVLIFLKQVRLPITLLFAFMGLNIFHIGHTTTNKSYYLLKARFATLNYWTLNQSFKPPFVCFINEKQKRFHDILIKYMCPLK